MRHRWIAVTIALSWSSASCDRSRSEPSSDTIRPKTGASEPSISAPPSSAPTAVAPAASSAWQGSYQSEATVLYIPPDWKDVHWKVKDTDTGIGTGAVSMHVDGASGRASGALEGPLGPATLAGVVTDGKVTAQITPKDPPDGGFAGTLVGSLANDRMEGTMSVSSGFAGAIRKATFTMAREGKAASR